MISLGISAVNNVPDIIKRPKLDIVPDNIESTDNQQMQQQNQGLPENEKNMPVSEEQIKNIIAQANKSLAGCSTKLEFSIHEQTKEIMVKVLDADTGEVIKEIPSEKSLDRFAMVLEEIGWLVDKKV
jgi:flagellar protein FlaG